MTPKQVKYVRQILEKEGISYMENDLAQEFSNNRTRDISKLTHPETQNLIYSFVDKSPKDKMQGKIMSMAHEMRWELPNGKIDLKRLDAWCIKHTPFHKPFDRLTVKELPKVVGIFEKVYKSYLKAI